MDELTKYKDFLSNLQNDDNPAFSEKIGKFVDENDPSEEVLNKLLAECEDKVKFGAFFTLLVKYRKQKDYSKSEELVKKYKSQYIEKPLFLYQLSAIHKHKMTLSDARLSIQYARDAITAIEKTQKKYPGFYQNFADAVVLALENKLINNSKLIDEGIENINIAITINPEYAKYYYTLGRLQILEKEFSEAKKNIVLAIDREDSTKKDYAIRISDYQDALMKCSIAQTMDSVEQSIFSIQESKKKLEDEFGRVRNSVIEFIGFFAAIIALVITSTHIAVNLALIDSIRLIGFLVGGIIIAIGCLRVILDFNFKSVGIALLIFIFGLLFIIFSFYIVRYI